MNNTTTLPTLAQFKNEAKALAAQNESLTHMESLHTLAREYGYRNFNAIRPALSIDIYPISFSEVQHHLDEHIKNISLLGGGYGDFFLLSGFRMAKEFLSSFEQIKIIPKKNLFFKNQEDILSFRKMFCIKTVVPLLDMLNKEKIDIYNMEMFRVLRSRPFYLLKTEVETKKELFEGLTSVSDIISGLGETWQASKHDLDLNILSHYQSDIQQFQYREQSIFFFLETLMKGELNKDYYKDMKKGREHIVKELDEGVEKYIEAYKSISASIKLHDSKKSFIDDMTINKPIMKRLPIIELFDNEVLGLIYDRWVDLRSPFMRITELRTYESVEDFIRTYNEMLDEIIPESV